MEFWGAEVKVGEPLLVSPGEEKILHLSQACLGESKSKGSEPVFLYVKVGNQKLVLGTLSSEKFPQVSFDLVFDTDFELSHNWKNGSVYFMGYTSLLPEDATEESPYTDSEEDLPLAATDNGKPEPQPKKDDVKPGTSGTKRKVQIVEPNKGGSNSITDSKKNEDSSDEDDDDEESTDDENANGGEADDSDDDENEISGVDSEDTDSEDSEDSLEEDEQTPKKEKAEASKKRPLESANKIPAPDKKAKLVTPQKTEGKKGVVHVATPHPSKQAGKAPAASDQNKQQIPKPAGGAFPCKTCKRAFGSETALQSHTKAKHSAEK